jgi:uncharacterized membrane protein HdeD (DUF308 family)
MKFNENLSHKMQISILMQISAEFLVNIFALFILFWGIIKIALGFEEQTRPNLNTNSQAKIKERDSTK